MNFLVLSKYIDELNNQRLIKTKHRPPSKSSLINNELDILLHKYCRILKFPYENLSSIQYEICESLRNFSILTVNGISYVRRYYIDGTTEK